MDKGSPVISCACLKLENSTFHKMKTRPQNKILRLASFHLDHSKYLKEFFGTLSVITMLKSLFPSSNFSELLVHLYLLHIIR